MEWILLGVWALLIPAVTIRLGGVLPLERGIFLAGAVLLWILSLLHANPRAIRRVPRHLWVPLLLFFSLILLTLVPLSPASLKLMGPLSARVWTRFDPADLAAQFKGHEIERSLRAKLSPDVFEPRPHPVSIYPEGTRTDLFLWFAGLLVAMAVAHGFTRRRTMRWACGILITYAVLQAMFGLVGYWTGENFGLFQRKIVEGAAGTFYNRNHFVDFIGMVFPLAVVLWVTQLRRIFREAPRDRWGRLRYVLNTRNGILPVLTMAVGVMALGIAFSLSRGGIASICGVLGLMLLVPPQNRRTRHASQRARTFRRRWLRTVGLIALFGVALVLWVGPEPIVERFARTDRELELHKNRLAAWKDAVHLFLASPVVGTGLGTFGEAFPLVQSFDTDMRWDYAHNEYLQLLTETGVLGVALVLWFALGIVRWLRTAQPRDTEFMLLRYGCGMGLIYLLVHAVADFNLHLPANVLLAASLLGLTLSLSLPRVQVMTDDTVTKRRNGWVTAFTILLLVVILWPAWRHFPAAMLTDALRVTAGENPPVPKAVLKKAEAWLKAPDGPSRLFQYLGVRRARTMDTMPTAAAAFYKALVLNPQDYISAHNLAQIFWKVYPSFRLADRFFELALTAAPAEATIWYQAGLFSWTVGDLDRAVQRFREAARLRPALLDRIYAQLSGLDEATWFLVVTPPSEYDRLARALVRYGHLKEARTILDRILETRDVETIAGVLDLVVTHPELERTDAFLTFLQPWRRRDPRIGFWAIYAKLEQGDRTGIPEAVRAVVREAERAYGIRDRRVLDMRRDLGRLLARYGFRRTAEALYLEIINLDPRYLEAYRAIALLAMAEGRWSRAFEYLKRAPMDETTGSLLSRIGDRALHSKDIALARSVFEYMRLRWLYRDRGLYGLAKLMAQEGDPWKAVDYMNEAVQINPENVAYRLYRAALLWDIGKRDAALQDYEAVLARQPGNRQALERLIQIAQLRAEAPRVQVLCRQAAEYGLDLQGCRTNPLKP